MMLDEISLRFLIIEISRADDTGMKTVIKFWHDRAIIFK